MKIYLSIIILTLSFTLQSQEVIKDALPYSTIPEAPQEYTAGTVVSRMLDGLGFRFYWATEQLTDNDLDYAPGNDGRTIRQTMEHLHGLSEVILNSAKKQATDRTVKGAELNSLEQRKATLENIKMASELFAKALDLNEHSIIFKRANGESEFPFWNNINGPIEDAIWHAGQIVVLRRSAGNPINPKVNVFLGKLND
ncbi:MAG: DinB family protein [Maribacter sp.]